MRRASAAIVVLVAVVSAGALLAGCAGDRSTYPVHAWFTNGQGLFPGNAVEVLGVKEGTVTAVRNSGDVVEVTMALPVTEHLPADVHASLVAPQILGEPDVDLYPGYTGGLALAPGATIPLARTSVPISIGQFLKETKSFLGALDAGSLSALVHNLAVDFQGEGDKLNSLIQGAAGTLSVLSQKGSELGQLEGNLAAVTETLDQHLKEIQSLIESYDEVSGVIAAHDSRLNDAITQLSSATYDLAQLLSPHLQTLEQDVGTVTSAGRTLDRNITNLDQTLQSAVALFASAHRSYDPRYNWIDLNLATPPGLTGAFALGLVRDRLAGVCRRIFAHLGDGMSQQETSTLQACGDPSSSFWQPLIETFLSADPQHGTGPADLQELFTQGLAAIPGLTPHQQASLSGSASAPAQSGGPVASKGGTAPSQSGGAS